MDSFFFDPFDGFRRVKNGHFAIYCDRAVASMVIPKIFEPHEICDTKQIAFRQTNPISLVLKKFSPLRERLFINWLRMKEVGIVHRILKYWNRGWPPCQSNGHFESVRIEYVFPIFLFLLVVYVVSIFILLIEIYNKAI